VTAPTVDIRARIAASPVELDDPAETFHEASRLAPSTVARQLIGSRRLAADPLLALAATRSSRRHVHRPSVELDPPPALPASLGRTLLDRRTVSTLGTQPLDRGELSTVLGYAYRCREREGLVRRPVPSAGGLYPLELYAIVRQANGIPAGAHHYDPFRHRLEQLTDDGPDELASAVVDQDLAQRASITVVVTAVFLRSQFKYGQRGYRFALLEAGHVAQNLLLVAHALGLDALPYGGYYDRIVDRLLGVDGLDEASVYVVFLGKGSR
jgi:SagB-type dehydrogenase family enzyme